MNSHSWAKELYDDYHQLDLEQLGPMVRGTEATEKQLKDLLDAHKENISNVDGALQAARQVDYQTGITLACLGRPVPLATRDY